jgi:3-oxoacyl-[acyl-carrier-protein] synthase III
MKPTLFACLAMALAVGGCDVYGNMNQDAPPDQRARLVIENAGSDAVLVINGETVGRAAAYDDEDSAFHLSQGNYQIEVREASDVLLMETVFATDGTTQVLSVPVPAEEPKPAQ